MHLDRRGAALLFAEAVTDATGEAFAVGGAVPSGIMLTVAFPLAEAAPTTAERLAVIGAAAAIVVALCGGAALVGRLVGRLLARFQLRDSPSALGAQGALLGGVAAALAALLVGAALRAWTEGGFVATALASTAATALLGAWGAICGGAAGLAVGRMGRRRSGRV